MTHTGMKLIELSVNTQDSGVVSLPTFKVMLLVCNPLTSVTEVKLSYTF